MTLLEKCKTVNDRLADLQQVRQQQTLADALNKRASELDGLQMPFVAAMSSTNVLCGHGIVNESRLPDSSRAAERIAGMRTQLAEEPQDITKGQAFNLMCRAVKKLTEQCEELAKETWKDHVKQTAPVVHTTLLNQFRDSPTHEDAVTRIEQNVNEIRSLVRKPPPDEETLERIAAKWEELRCDIGTLPVTDDPEIQAFLNAAISGGGAALDLLTKSVKTWLETNNMLSDFCIRRTK